ncbi:DUF1684 domain-containing protein [Streptomyces sp. NPDC101166]|uniref:DUF1684 domain-containing protein n=1 Tax=Streptomyces sp. NPDC101166 TaxID=3366120 RepID=UPI00382BABC2
MTDPAIGWKRWHERRVEAVCEPYGPLALKGTYWPVDHPEGRLPDIPGTWVAEEGGVTITASEADGLTVDGKPFSGRLRLTADQGPVAAARVAHGARRLVVLVREGVWGVRDFDPDAEARRRFRGIGATAFDPRWSVPARFIPYGESRTVRVPNADGRERGLGLDGEIAFRLDGRESTLRASVRGDGSLWAVFADATSGNGGHRFRFLYPAAPDAEGRTIVDLNRAELPPCAFSDAFFCPFPPPGNTLPAAVEAGERALI